MSTNIPRVECPHCGQTFRGKGVNIHIGLNHSNRPLVKFDKNFPKQPYMTVKQARLLAEARTKAVLETLPTLATVEYLPPPPPVEVKPQPAPPMENIPIPVLTMELLNKFAQAVNELEAPVKDKIDVSTSVRWFGGDFVTSFQFCRFETMCNKSTCQYLHSTDKIMTARPRNINA